MVNTAILIGNLTKAPEYNEQYKICKFGLATSEKWKDKNGDQKEKTEFHNIVTFGKLAEICYKYLIKGSKAYISGKIEYDSYEKDGEKKKC